MVTTELGDEMDGGDLLRHPDPLTSVTGPAMSNSEQLEEALRALQLTLNLKFTTSGPSDNRSAHNDGDRRDKWAEGQRPSQRSEHADDHGSSPKSVRPYRIVSLGSRGNDGGRGADLRLAMTGKASGSGRMPVFVARTWPEAPS
jgi:hypothetical protein